MLIKAVPDPTKVIYKVGIEHDARKEARSIHRDIVRWRNSNGEQGVTTFYNKLYNQALEGMCQFTPKETEDWLFYYKDECRLLANSEDLKEPEYKGNRYR